MRIRGYSHEQIKKMIDEIRFEQRVEKLVDNKLEYFTNHSYEFWKKELSFDTIC